MCGGSLISNQWVNNKYSSIYFYKIQNQNLEFSDFDSCPLSGS